MRFVYKIAICISLVLAGNHSAANSSDASFTDSLSPQERLVACTDVIQDSNTSRSHIAYSWLRRGYALRELGKPGQAVAEFDQAIGLYPNYAEAHLGSKNRSVRRN